MLYTLTYRKKSDNAELSRNLLRGFSYTPEKLLSTRKNMNLELRYRELCERWFAQWR